MDKVIKKNWVKALLSRKYRQVTGALKRRLPGRHCGHCCLGVLCDVVDKSRWEKRLPYSDDVSYDGNFGTLSNSVVKKVGLTHRQVEKLVEMNDNDGKTFQEIAQYIEGKL